MSGADLYRNSAEDKQRLQLAVKLPQLPDEYRAELFQTRVEWVSLAGQHCHVSFPATVDVKRAMRQYQVAELDFLVQEAIWARKIIYGFVGDGWKVLLSADVPHRRVPRLP